MGDSGRLRALAALYVAVVGFCACLGIWDARPGLSTLALVLTLPAGFAYGPLSLGVRTVGYQLEAVSAVLLIVLAAVNVVVLGWIRRALPADPAASGVADRLARTLVGSGVTVTPMARSSQRVRTATGEIRVERSLDLRDLPMPYRDLLAMFRATWQHAGLAVQDRPDPPAVRAFDEQGYEFLVEPGPYGEAVLQVASPPARERGFLIGALVSGVPTVALFVLGLIDYLSAGAYVTPLLIDGCVLVGPAALIGGVLLLFRFPTRAFGRGLLLGGLPSLAVALLYAVPLVLQGR